MATRTTIGILMIRKFNSTSILDYISTLDYILYMYLIIYISIRNLWISILNLYRSYCHI